MTSDNICIKCNKLICKDEIYDNINHPSIELICNCDFKEYESTGELYGWMFTFNPYTMFWHCFHKDEYDTYINDKKSTKTLRSSRNIMHLVEYIEDNLE